MTANTCKHEDLLLEVSVYAEQTSYERPLESHRAAATTLHGTLKKTQAEGVRAGDPSVFPGPLVLPGDDLTGEEDTPQSLRSWIRDPHRNEVTAERRTIYVVPPPKIDQSIAFIADWTKPAAGKLGGVEKDNLGTPDGLHKDVAEYLSAFFYPLTVKLHDRPMRFIRRNTSRGRGKAPAVLDIAFGNGLLMEVRTRPCPDKTFARQMDLNNLTEILMKDLPSDAYAMIMLVEHDMYEHDDDDFCCGRAFGGSRIAVVSTARYNPLLDANVGLDVEHAWPASHCRAFVERCIEDELGPAIDGLDIGEQTDNSPRPAKRRKTAKPKARKKAGSRHDPTNSLPSELQAISPMQAAVAAYRDVLAQQQQQMTTELSQAEDRRAVLARRWLSRVCRTASHELGHCFGVEHCLYYACLMQASAGVLEDARQPLYLCPVDRQKVLRAIMAVTGGDEDDVLPEEGDGAGRLLEREADLAMAGLCEAPAWRAEATFAALAAWLRAKN